MQTIFVINPAAGKQNAAPALIPQIRAAAQRAGAEVRIEVTRAAGHAEQIAAQAAASGETTRLYACGGDGTLREVLQQAARHPNVQVGSVPCGSGNDYVRNFGGSAKFLDFDAQLAARPVDLDLIETEYGYAADIVAAGLDAQVAYGIPKFRRLPLCGGTTAYTLSILQAVFGNFRHRIAVQTDEGAMQDDYMLAAICNGRLYGGGYCAAPYASMRDGMLDVLLVKPVPRIKLPGFLAAYKKGQHLLPDGSVAPAFAPYMQFTRTHTLNLTVEEQRPIIATLDGECAPCMQLHASVASGAWQALLPAGVEDSNTVLAAECPLQTGRKQNV